MSVDVIALLLLVVLVFLLMVGAGATTGILSFTLTIGNDANCEREEWDDDNAPPGPTPRDMRQ